MKKYIYAILIIAFAQSIFSQIRYFDERYISLMSNLNPILINPGATGFGDDHRVMVNYKNTWSGFDDTPTTFLASYDGSVANNLGVGLLLLSDSNVDLETTKVQGSVAYTVNSVSNRLSVGIAGEFIRHGLSGSVAINPLTLPGDDLIANRIDGSSFFDVSLGLYGIYDNTITYGLSLPSLVSTTIDGESGELAREIGFIANVGYIYKGQSNVIFEPSLFIKRLNQVPLHVDLNLLGRFLDDKLRGGAIFSVGGEQKVGFIIGTTINTLQFDYGYNASRNDFQDYNNGSHELSLKFSISGKRTLLKEIEKVDIQPVEQQ